MDIKRVKANSDKIKAFEEIEWSLADIEHYGKAIDMAKKKYKFVSENDAGEITGTLDLMIEANIAFLESLLVGSKFRRMGIGKKLLEQAEELAKEKKCTKIWLETNEGWESVEFYKKNGYRVTGEHEKHIMNQKTLIFTKFL